MATIFLSAESKDYAPLRKKVAKQSGSSELRIDCQEDLRNTATCSLGNIAGAVKEAFQVFCVVGHRSGSFVPRQQVEDVARSNPAFRHLLRDYLEYLAGRGLGKEEDGRLPVSYTQCELLLARAERKGVLFLHSPQGPSAIEDAHQSAFREWLRRRSSYSFDSSRFPKSEKDIGDQIAAAHRHFLAEIRKGGKWVERKRDLVVKADSLVHEADTTLTARDELCKELLESAEGHPATLLIAGASFGKSSLMQMLLRGHVERVAAYYRFDLDDSESQAATDFVESLAAQIAEWARSHMNLEIDKLGSGLRNALQSKDKSAPVILRELLAALRDAKPLDAERGRYLILVDALDEAAAAVVRKGDVSPGKADLVHQLLCGLLGGEEKDVDVGFPDWLRIIATSQPSVIEGPLAANFRRACWNIVDKRYSTSGDKQERHKEIQQELDNAIRRTSERCLAESRFSRALKRGEDVDCLAKALVEKVDGNFLYLTYLLKDIRDSRPESVDRKWVFEQPANLTKYYRTRFGQWFPSQEDQADIRRLLCVMLAVRKPQTPAALSELFRPQTAAEPSRLNTTRVLDLLGRMAAFVEAPSEEQFADQEPRVMVREDQPVELHHSSTLREWLGSSRSGFLAIAHGEGDLIVAHKAIEALGSLAGRQRDQRCHDLLHEFFLDHGLYHVLTAAMVSREHAATLCASVIPLAALLNRQSAWPDLQRVAGSLRHYNGVLFDLLESLRGVTTHCDILRNLDRSCVESLVTLVKYGCSEIPKLYPPLRILVDYHLGALEEHALEITQSDQLLTRYTLGRAVAGSFHDPGDDREGHRRQIASLVKCWFSDDPEADEDLRETGCYALKSIYAQGNKAKGDDLEFYFPEYVARCAQSADYNPRMALSEMLIELALSGRRGHLLKSLDGCVPHVEFWRPYWPYHELDLCEMFGSLAVNAAEASPPPGSGIPQQGESGRFASDHTDEIQRVVNRLRTARKELESLRVDLPRAMKRRLPAGTAPQTLPGWSDIQKCLDWGTYRKTEMIGRLLLRAGRHLGSLSVDEESLQRFLLVFVLHPTWEITETAASVVADLREIHRSPIDAILLEWSRNETYWQPRYAAIDAAYNSRHLDRGSDEELFQRLVMRHYGGVD